MEDQTEDRTEDQKIAEAKQLVADAIAKLKIGMADRTFSGRHPELGKMVKCQICLTRHRAAQVCRQRFVTELVPPDGLTSLTKKQIHGAAAFAKKRRINRSL